MNVRPHILLPALAVWMLLAALPAFGQIDDGTGQVQPTVPRPVTVDDPFGTGSGLEGVREISQGRSSTSGSAHPLGLLPNPEIRSNTRFTYEDLIWRELDTTLRRFHVYDPADRWYYPHSTLGITGQHAASLVFDPEFEQGPHPGITAFREYLAGPENVRYFNTKTPYTKLSYILGADTENNGEVVHSQNIGPYFNAAFDYRLLNVQGAYTSQKTLMHNMAISNWLNTKSRRYTLLLAFLFNKMVHEENGGIDLDGLFQPENANLSRSQVPININNGDRVGRNHGLRIKQLFYLGDKKTVQTSDTTEMEVVERRSALSYGFTFNNWKLKYTDAESDFQFYKNFFFDSTMTGDSTRYWTVRHTLRWENTPEAFTDTSEGLARFRYFAALDYDYTKYANFDVNRRLHRLFLSGGVNSNPLRDAKWHYGISAKLFLGPDEPGDYKVNAFVRWRINELMRLRAVLETGRSRAGVFQEAYRSNHYRWDNDFDPIYHHRVSLRFHCSKGDIDGELTWHNVQGLVYLAESGNDLNYTQSASNLNVLVFRAGKAFDWKHFYLYNGISAQYISDRSQLRLPKFFLEQSFYYQGGFFSGLLNAHLGFDITYHTDYYADGYSPALLEYYLQDAEKLKFYPVIDVFFEIMIKRVRLFFMMEHVNQGMFRQKGYYEAPDYPAQDRAFKLGVSWEFFD